jgi:hypothetical protein
LNELVKLVLDKNWDHQIRQQILSSKQGNHVFIDWKIELENLNAILTTSSPTCALNSASLKNQLKANLNEELLLNLTNEPILAMELAAWSLKVKERDERMQAENERMLHLIQANNVTCTAC